MRVRFGLAGSLDRVRRHRRSRPARAAARAARAGELHDAARAPAARPATVTAASADATDAQRDRERSGRGRAGVAHDDVVGDRSGRRPGAAPRRSRRSRGPAAAAAARRPARAISSRRITRWRRSIQRACTSTRKAAGAGSAGDLVAVGEDADAALRGDPRAESGGRHRPRTTPPSRCAPRARSSTAIVDACRRRGRDRLRGEDRVAVRRERRRCGRRDSVALERALGPTGPVAPLGPVAPVAAHARAAPRPATAPAATPAPAARSGGEEGPEETSDVRS